VTRIPSSFVITWIVTALVAIVMWLVLPGSSVDRELLKLLAQWHTGSPVEISGKGSQLSPWQSKQRIGTGASAVELSTIGLKDNLEGIFAGSPHSPLDLAVIFDNLQRLGSKQLACSVLLAWEKPDPAALTAMEMALGKFESVVLAAPVTRGAIMEAMPSDFRNASLPLDALSGDTSALPVVNRVSIPDLIRGGKNAMAGFEVIDSEPTADHMHLMARWDDRVIFAFPVVATLQKLGIDLKDLKIEVGSHLQLGEKGPLIPIDEFGRIAIDQIAVSPKTDLLAKELLDAEAADPKLPDLTHALLCDLRSHADITSRDFNRMIPSCMEKLLQGQGKSVQINHARLSGSVELPLLLVLALGLSCASLLARRLMVLTAIIALAGCAIATWVGFQNELWLPGLAAAVTVAVALACAVITGGKRKRTTSMPRLDRLKFDSLEDSD